MLRVLLAALAGNVAHSDRLHFVERFTLDECLELICVDCSETAQD